MNPLPAIPSRARPPLSAEAAAPRGESPGAGGRRVGFQAADGREAQGAVIRLSRHAVTFELLNADVALRTSEALNGFKIFAGGRALFFGRAVVSGLVNSGSSLVCEAKLSPPENETACFLPAAEFAPSAREAYEQFFGAWQQEYQIAPEFKVLVVDIAAYLTGVRQWLEQVEFGLAQADDRQRAEQEREILEAAAARVIQGFNLQHERFEELAERIPPERLGAHQEFVRRHWHRLFLCAPFGHRTFHKPLGIAGDYEMMNMIYRNQPEGRSLYEKLIHLLLVSQWPARSVRNRVTHLHKTIVSETARVARAGRRARILSVACGPAKELQDFMRDSPLSGEMDGTLLDFNQAALDHAESQLNVLRRRHARRARISTVNLSVNQLLRRAVRQGDLELGGQFDLIYCAGLFDYLSEHTCRELVHLFCQNATPGGLVVAGNMDDAKPFRRFIEFVLDWQLIYRHAPEIARFAPEEAAAGCQVMGESAWSNLFLHARRPD